MKTGVRRIFAMILSVAMVFTTTVLTPGKYQKSVMADAEESFVTDFSYDFAYTTPGYADGTIRISASEDGVYKIFWGDADGNKLTKNGYEYSYLARVIVKDGKGSFNIISDYTAIPEGAETALVYKKDVKQYVYEIPEEKKFVPQGEAYTFGALSDLHYGRYSTVYDDDAVPAVDNAFDFLDNAGVKFVGISGDLTAGGEQASLDKYNEALAKHPDITAVICTGNHDSRTTISTSSTSTLDTSITRWYNSISSSYYTVEADGKVNNKLSGYPILANDALTNPISTQYRPYAGAEAEDTTVPGLDFVTEAGGNIFIFFNEIAKTGETYNVDDLITTGQMDWLKEQLETYRDRKVFVFFHSYLPVNTLNNDVADYNNCTGDLRSDGGYSYNLDFKDVVTTSDGMNLQALLSEYSNVTMLSGHSHWQYAMQELNANLNIGQLKNGEGATLVHLSSVTEPRYVGRNDAARTELNGFASEGTTVTTYDSCTVYNSIDFYNSRYEAYATYIVSSGEDSGYEPVKNPNYTESTDAITGDEYLEAEDLTTMQLLKSNYNLVYGADYTQSSVGGENSIGKLTDGKISGGFVNTKRDSNAKNQEFVIDLGKDKVQNVNNIDYFLLYFQNNLTYATDFNVSVSMDGSTYETVGTYSNVDAETNHFEPDFSNVTLEQFRYVKLNLTAGKTEYGYQVKEFAVIGINPIEYPEIADQSGLVTSVTRNIALNQPVIVSSTYDKEGSDPTVLTDGKKDGYWSTDWDSSRTSDYIIVDLGSDYDVASISSVLVNYKSENTFCENYSIEVSKTYNADDPTEGFYEIAKVKAVSWEILQKYSDINGYVVTPITDVASDSIRYVKINMSGHKSYGYQVYEVAVILGENDLSSDKTQVSIVNTDDIVYTGNEIKPEVTVTYADKILTENKDYTLTYSDNINAGPAKYTVTGIGEYSGTVTGKFTIAPQNLKSDLITVDDTALAKALEFSGKEQTPAVVLSYNNKKLTEKDDYTIEYTDNLYPGPAQVVITGVGNYTGQITKTFEIVKKAMENVTVTTSFDEANELVVTVENAGYEMVEGQDYTYDVDTDVFGNITITISAAGDYYEGEIVEKIDAADNPNRPSVEITGENQFTYTGSEIKPDVEVKIFNEILTMDVDYTLSYENNINAGPAIVHVVGIGTYEGVIDDTYNFEILPKNISDADIVVDDSNLKDNFEFNGKDRTPIVKLTYGGILLNAMGDYTVRYENNFYPGTAKVTITGIGNYTGEITRTFVIIKKPIENVTIRTSFDANNKLVVTVNNGSYAMTYGKDYTYTTNTDAQGNITITFTGLGNNYAGTFVKVIDAKDNPAAVTMTTAEPTTKAITVKKTKITKKKNLKGQKVRIVWKKLSGVTGYRIQYSTNKKFKKAKRVTKKIKTNKKKYTIKKLKLNKTYYIRIRAYRVYNGKTYLGEWSKVKKIKIKK